MSIIIFIIILGVLVISHEFGHFIVARLFNIRVDEFGFGYPPRALKLFKKGDTTYTLNWLPFGGFVKIFGEDPSDENTNGPDRERSFVHKPWYAQALVLVAGVVANLVVAWILFAVGFMSGLPTSVSTEKNISHVQNPHLVITGLTKDAPAEKANLKIGDSIDMLTAGSDSLSSPNPETLSTFVTSHAKEPINVTYTRGKSAPAVVSVTAQEGIVKDKAIVGISMDMVGTLQLPFFKALLESATLTLSLTKDTAVSLGKLLVDSVKGRADLSSISGPVGIVGIVGDAYSFGFVYLLSFTALISINLVIINLIPFPALDGGRLLFVIIEKIKGSRINPKVANTLNAVGFFLLIALMLVVTYHDILKLI